MSTFDLHKIADALLSSKIKQRSEALTLLAGISASKLKLHPRQSNVLVNALLKLIELERNAYAHNCTNPVVSRLSSASSCLEDLVEEELKTNKNPRYKPSIAVVTTIISNYFVNTQLLEPCTISFSNILHAFLLEEFFRTHLTVEAWLRIYKFLNRAIDNALDDSGNLLAENEKLLCNLFQSMSLLIGGDTSLVYLPIYQDNAYFPLLQLITRCLKMYDRRESSVLIACFKLINKLAVILSTEDCRLCNHMIKHAFKTILQFSSTSVEPLFDQFAIFINLEPMYRCFNINQLPKLIGAENDIVGDANELDQEMTEIQLYTVGMLIQNLIIRSCSSVANLSLEEIHISDDSHRDWFSLSTFRYVSQDTPVWLLFTGLTKLINSYYILRSQYTDVVEEGMLSSSRNLSVSVISTTLHIHKRRKFQDQRTRLWRCDSPILFYMSLLTNQDDHKIQLCGIQLFSIHCDLFEKRTEWTSQPSNLNAETSTATWNLNDSTVLDLDLVSSKDSSLKLLPSLTVLVRILSEFTNKFWPLICCRSLLSSMDLRIVETNKILAKRLHQLIKLLLPIIKDKDCCTISTSLIVDILLLQSKTNLHTLIDESMKSQLINIFELSDLAGPAKIDLSAIKFWWCIAKLLRGVVKTEDISLSVSRWFAAKWSDSLIVDDTGMKKYSGQHMPDVKVLQQLLSWVSGHKVVMYISKDHVFPAPCEEHYSTLYNELKLYSKLGMFISEQSINTPEKLDKYVQTMFFPLPFSSIAIQTICALIIEVASLVLNSEESLATLVTWATSLTKLLDIDIDTLAKSELLNLACETWQIISHRMTNSKDSALVALSILQFQISKNILTEISFPFDTLMVRFNESQKNTRLIKERAFEVDMDFDDFSSSDSLGRQSSYTSRQSSIKLSDDENLSIFKFSITYELDDPIRQIELFEAHISSQCLQLYVTFLKSRKIETTSRDSLIRLVRVIGEGPLAEQSFDRSDVTISTCCELLGILLPLCHDDETKELEKDTRDLFKYLSQCMLKGLFLTELKTIKFWRLFLSCYHLNFDFEGISKPQLMATFFEDYEDFPNNTKIQIADAVGKVLSRKDSSSQMKIYKELFVRFSNPQASIERGATYCLFFCLVTGTNKHLRMVALFNFLECIKFDFFKPYLKGGIQIVSDLSNHKTGRDMFISSKFELLKSWWRFNHDFLDFPYDLFGYQDQNSFLSENYKDIVAIVTAIKSESKDNNLIIQKVAQIKQSDAKSLICDSLPLIVPMAYTSEGLRNIVFKSLAEYLSDLYQTYMRQKLPLIVLEIIRFTDFRSEKSFLPGLSSALNSKCLRSDIVVDISLQVVVSPTSSLDLINAMISKYWILEQEPFWTSKTVFFLIRQLGRNIPGEQENSKIILLRAIKYVLCLSNLPLSVFELFKLVVDICAPIAEPTIDSDIYTIWNLFDMNCLVDVTVKESITTVFTILCKLCEHSNLPEKMRFLEELDVFYRVHFSKFGKSNPLIRAAMNCCQVVAVNLTYNDIEEFLIDPSFRSPIETNPKVVLSLLSCLLKYAVKVEISNHNMDLVKFFWDKDTTTISDDLKLWISKYLSGFYLSGSFERESESIFENNEFSSSEKEEFSQQIGRMDFFLNVLIKDLQDDNYEKVAFVETLLGSLIWKYESKRGDVQKYMNFEHYYSQLKAYLLPLDFHSCVLINSTDNSLDFSTRSLDSFVVNLSSLISDNSFENWSSQLLLSVTQELASYTSIASLLASYVLKFPANSSTIFPNIVCFYISLAGKEGAKKVRSLIDSFWKCFTKPYDFQAVEMFKNTILMVRIGAKLNIVIFRELYASLKKKELFMIVKEGAFPKTALLLFEDSVEGDSNQIDWKSQIANLSSIYESLDDEDLFLGLPEDPSVEHALGLISQFGSSAEKVHYSSGQLDASLLLTGSSNRGPFVQSLIDDGLLGLSKAMGSENETNHNSYEWAWKLNLWDIPLPEKCHGKHDTVYSYFKLVHESPNRVQGVYEKSILGLMDGQKHLSTERMSTREKKSHVLKWFETLSIIESLNSILHRPESEFIAEACRFGAITLWFKNADLEYFEDILKARQIAFKLYTDRKALRQSLEDMISHSVSQGHDICLQGFSNEVVRSIEMYRQNSQVQKMVSATMLLDKFVKSSDFHDRNVQDELLRLSKFQFAKTLWSDGKTSIPVAMLRELEQDGSIVLPLVSLNVNKTLILATLVKWLAESRQVLGSTILTLIVDPLKEAVGEVDDHHQRANVYHILAYFCEQQYKSRNLIEQLEDLTKRVQSKRKEIDEIKTHYGRTSVSAVEKKTVQKYYNRLKSLVMSEESELSSLKRKREVFASNAVKFYLNSLLVGDEYIADMDNFFSLFLELSNDHELQANIKNNLECLPSFKPLSWCTQLLSRVSSDNSQFQQSVQNLIFRICQDHPFHSLYNLISLIKNEDIALKTSNSIMLARVDAAKKLRHKLANHSSEYNSAFLMPIERLCDESITLSEYRSAKGKKLDLEKLKIGSYWVNDLPSIPPPTLEIPVSQVGYADVPRMVSIVPKVSIAMSGLSLPKIATFILSDGSEHKMLLKHGTDDLRQDATMEQVFEKVNNIFEKDRETRKRHLRVRTYKAVPLGPKAGVIEFVLHSKALIEVIRPYHQKFDSLKSEVARSMMKECQTSNLNERLRVYNKISSQIHPVLHHFFMDNFVTPDAWYRSRQIYTRGIAATSMVGHILGLGDRHCNNILLDEFTGEPIHIDLGVAFDQGKRLPIPETVPFRLTRDLVDGFGVTGTKGSFSKLCEHSFRVLRSNKERILAIVDVLRWDPLYSWSISPIRKQKLQDENGFQGMVSHEDGSEASTALLTVVEKLNVGGLSVEATVRELIHEATAVENLAVIYCGWCPFF